MTDETALTPTSQYLGASFNAWPFMLQGLLAMLVGIVCLFFAPLASGLILIFAGLVFLYSERIRHHRRLGASPILRPPAAPELSAWLLAQNWIWFEVLKALITFVAAYTISPFTTLLSTDWLLFIGASILIHPILAVGMLSLVKFHFDKGFRILVFRRNRAATNFSHKAVVMPACGMIGQVLLLYDESLFYEQEGSLRRRALWWISEMYNPLSVEDNDAHWRQVVMMELAMADLAMLDWAGEVTPNMIWELDEAVRCLPPERILVLTSADTVLTAEVQRRISETRVKICPHPTDPASTNHFKRLLMAMALLSEPKHRPEISVVRQTTMREKIYLDRIDWKAFAAGTPQP